MENSLLKCTRKTEALVNSSASWCLTAWSDGPGSPGSINIATKSALLPHLSLLSFPCLSLSSPPWPAFLSHLSPSPPLYPFFFPFFTLSLLCNVVLKYASGRQGWAEPDSWRIDGTLLRSGDHTHRDRERDKEVEGAKFCFVCFWCGCGDSWSGVGVEMMKNDGQDQSWASIALAVNPTPHCSKPPSSWLDVTSRTFLLAALTERQDTDGMYCAVNRLTKWPIFSAVTVLLQNYLH